MTVRGRISSRVADERLLGWVEQRASGESCSKIAKASGDVQRAAVIRATNAVLHADLLESGEPVVLVQAAYWPVRGRR